MRVTSAPKIEEVRLGEVQVSGAVALRLVDLCVHDLGVQRVEAEVRGLETSNLSK